MPQERELKLNRMRKFTAWVLSLQGGAPARRRLRVLNPKQGDLLVGVTELVVTGTTRPNTNVFVDGNKVVSDEHGLWGWVRPGVLPYGKHEIVVRDGQGQEVVVEFVTVEEFPEDYGFVLAVGDDHVLDVGDGLLGVE